MLKILLVEDDELMRGSLRLGLTRAGHAVTEAENGKQALEAFRNQRPDIVVTDLIMPEVEGLETIKTIRTMDTVVKIIAMSGGGRMGPENYLPMAKCLGANHLLYKPFPIIDLLALLKSPSKIKT